MTNPKNHRTIRSALRTTFSTVLGLAHRASETAIIACLGPRPKPSAREAAAWAACFVFLSFAVAPILARLVPAWFQWNPGRIPELLAEVSLRAFKEEALFRALPYFLIHVRGPRMGDGKFILASAVLFVLAHEVNFSWLRADPLTLATLSTLFFFGVATGALFVRQGNIWGCLAIHAGWNVMRFQLGMVAGGGEGARPLTEGEGFHLLEGSPYVLALSAFLAITLFWNLPPRSGLHPSRVP